MKTNHTCKNCGKVEDGNWIRDTALTLEKLELCFTCQFWTEVSRQEDTYYVPMIGVYTVGPEPPDPNNYKGCLGHGGQEFTLQLKHGGTIITHNLWFRGMPPVAFIDNFREASFKYSPYYVPERDSLCHMKKQS